MRKITIAFLASLMYTGCSTVENDRVCIDWRSREVVREKCIPLYGQLICSSEIKTELYCVLYDEETE